MRSNSRADILRCALNLFSQKGYEGTSPNEIVEAVGITKPTLYYFFGDKEGLLDTLLAESYAKLNGILEAVCVYIPAPEDYKNDVNPLLIRIARAIFDFAESNREFYMLSLSLNTAPAESKSARISEKYCIKQYEILTQLFADIAKAHCNLSGKEVALAFRFLALLNAQVTLWLRGKGDLSNSTAKSIVTGFMHGIFS